MNYSVSRCIFRVGGALFILVLLGTVLSTGSVAADGDFAVEIQPETPDSVDENGNLDIEVIVTNRGSDEATQDITLENDDGIEQATDELTLSSGETNTTTLTWKNVPGRPDTRVITPTVKSDNDIDSKTVQVDWLEFEVQEPVEVVYPDTGGSSVEATFKPRIRNIGTISGEQQISLFDPDSEVEEQTTVSIEGGNSTEVLFSNIPIPADQDDYTYEIKTENNTQTVDVNEPPLFTVNIDSTNVEESTFDLVATVENEGGFEDTQSVKLTVDGDQEDRQKMTLSPGESKTVTFQGKIDTSRVSVNATVKAPQLGIASTEVTRALDDINPEIHSVSPQFVQSTDDLTVNYTAEGSDIATVTIDIIGPNGATVQSVEVSPGIKQDRKVVLPEIGDLPNGNYDVNLKIEDDFGRTRSTTRTDAFEIDTIFDPEQVDFNEERYETPAGDFVEIDISTGDLDEAYILVGGDREANEGNLQNYLDVLHVSGDATFVINTRLVGTNVSSEKAYVPVEGEVTSYAHSIGAASEPEGVFGGVRFQNEKGNQIAPNLAEFQNQVGLSARGSPVQPGRYRLVAAGSGTVITRDDNIPGVRHPVARTNLVLQPPEIANVTTYTLPPAAANRVDQFEDAEEPAGVGDIGALLDAATETDTVAEGDRILIEVQSVGMYGALMKDIAATNPAVNTNSDEPSEIPASDVRTLLENHEGVHIELADSELAAPNRPGADLKFTGVDSSDLYILPDDTDDQWNGTDPIGTDPLIGGMYIIVDTRDTEAFRGRPTDGDELTFEIAYESPADERYEYQDYSLINGEQPDPFDPDVDESDGIEHFPYFGDSGTTVSATDSFIFEEPYIDYGKTTLDNELIVPAEEDGVIAGETNIAPGSQAEIQLIASNRPVPKVVTIEDIEIDEDRSFEVTEDFTGFEPGERVEVEFYSQGRLIDDRLLDKRGVRVVSDLDNPAAFEITNFTDSVEVTRGQRLSEIVATITNTGEIADRQAINFTIDGETVREQPATLYGDESVTLDLSDKFVVLSPGEYNYTVRTDDDAETGQLTVVAADDGTQLSSLDSNNATTSESPEETDSEEPGVFGLFGIRRRDVAVAAAVTGVMHILGQWT